MKISVAICTHNPNPARLAQVIDALRQQSLPVNEWELLLIDNRSNTPLASTVQAAWQPNFRVVREEALGLTRARICGINQAQADLLVFVDDDNLLAANYLAEALRIGTAWPLLGAWGGSAIPQFEVPPQDWMTPYLKLLALREVKRDQWSNVVNHFEAAPFGAGLCIRSTVARAWRDVVLADRRRIEMDRVGGKLTSCGDSDLAFTACDVGLGTGVFQSLRLTHLIPAERLTEDYLFRLATGIKYSFEWLLFFRGEVPNLPRPSAYSQLREWLHRRIRRSRSDRFRRAEHEAKLAAIRDIHASLGKTGGTL